MLEIIDAEYFRRFFTMPDGAERLDRIFANMMGERDAAINRAECAEAGFKALRDQEPAGEEE